MESPGNREDTLLRALRQALEREAELQDRVRELELELEGEQRERPELGGIMDSEAFLDWLKRIAGGRRMIVQEYRLQTEQDAFSGWHMGIPRPGMEITTIELLLRIGKENT